MSNGSLSPDTKLSFTASQMFSISAAFVASTAAVVIWMNTIKADVSDLRASMDMKLARIESAIKENTDRERDIVTATDKRVADWNPWRWRVTVDIIALGKVTKTPVYTKEEWK